MKGERHSQYTGKVSLSSSFICRRKEMVVSKYPSRASPILPCIGLLAIFSLTGTALLFLLHKVEKTKTVTGHNLEPTPWHPFAQGGSIGASTILRCSFLLTCDHTTPSTSQGNQQQQEEQGQGHRLPSSPSSCPSFFRWIHHDLAPWTHSRISISNLMEAREYAAFRVIIAGGRLYADFYYACVQSRAMFTVWGLLQLLRRHPGSIPDVDLMFDCMDKPTISRSQYNTPARPPPPLFRYCTTDHHFDIPFPDWSFWGWTEVNIGPWDEEFRSIKEGSQALDWTEKHPTAHWKGNPDVDSPVRTELLHCNDSRSWGAEIMRQNWAEEAKFGFEQSKLSRQCDHRYKIYAEGYAWSVSLKYIISCGSLALMIHPQYDDFFSRGLVPRKHFWPISPTNLCPSIKFAVDWGNEHPFEAEAIGKRGQHFVQDLNMERVYDYMYHLVMEYSKLQDFKPVPPPSAQEMCEESLLCFADPKQRKFLKKSYATPSLPCTLPLPDHRLVERWIQEKQEIINGVEKLEKKANMKAKHIKPSI
ncbi:hypothetical protein AAC387_Pa07g3911 [Persea americana]